MAIEGWGVAVAAGVAVAGVAGAVISSNAQAGAAQTAAGAQEQAAQLQANTQAGMYNASQVQNQPARTAGGEALQRETYLLGLDPNLNISGDTSIAQINPSLSQGSGGLTFSGPGGAYINNELGTNTNSTGLPAGWGTPAAGSNVNGGYGTSGGNPVAAAPGTAAMNNPGNPYNPNGVGGGPSGSTGLVGNSASGPGATVGVGPPGTANTQPVAPGTAQAMNVNPFRGGTPSAAPAVGTTPTNVNPISGTPNTGSTSGGYGSLSSVYNPSTFYNDPSYQFEMQTQQLALNKQEAASGGLYSTGALNNALQYAQGLASTDYQNAFNRSQSAQNQQFNYLQALTGGGQVGTNNVGAAGANAAAGISSAAAGYGNAVGAGAIGSANAVSNGVNSAVGFGTNALNSYNQSQNQQNNSNPYNLGGSTPVAPPGSTLTYDASGNITGSTPT